MLRPNAYHTLTALNLNLLDEIWLDETIGMPVVDACDVIPLDLIAFNKTKRTANYDRGVHFFIEDYSFNHLWTSPSLYLQRLAKFKCVISPDFSTYFDMPPPMIIWQIYRRRFITQWLQRSGLNVIYNVQTMAKEYDDMQLSGIEEGGVIMMKPPLRYKHNQRGRNEFYRLIHVVNERLKPKILLIYGEIRNLPTNINIKCYDNDNIRIRRTFTR